MRHALHAFPSAGMRLLVVVRTALHTCNDLIQQIGRQRLIAQEFKCIFAHALGNLTQISPYQIGKYMILDSFTRRNLELTETVDVFRNSIFNDTLKQLKDYGFTFSMDDYGTGYSNIAYMYEMPFSIIKIDKSILWKAIDPKTGEGQGNAVIYLENTIRMLKSMDYMVLVEGVESLEQKMFLESLDVDYLQGYYFSKPVRKQVFTDYLKVVNA